MVSPADGGAGRGRSHWSQWASWLAGAFAIVANIVGVVEIATASRFLLALIAGALAMVGGVVWLWRLLRSGYPTRTHRRLLALNLAIMLFGAGIVGYVSAGRWQSEPQGHNQAASPPPGSPSPSTDASPSPTSASPPTSTTGPGNDSPLPGATSTTPDVPPGRIPPPTPTTPTTPPKTIPTTQPLGNRPFTGTIWVRHPLFGETLASGEALSGEVTGWTTGHQVWLSSRAEGSSAELVQGPCQVNGSTFTCPEVQLAGASGTREYIHVAVVTDEAAGQLNDANTSPLDNASASDQTQIYKG